MKNKQKIIVDVLMALGFVLMFRTGATGLTVHEIVGLITGIIMITHLLTNWRWVVEITKKVFTKIPGRTRFSYILNVLSFLTMIVFIFSGLLISRIVMPTLGLQFNVLNSVPWRTVHIFSGQLAVLIFGVHLGLHWDWVKNVVRKMFAGKKEVKYGKQIVQGFMIVTLLVGGISAVVTMGSAGSQAVALVTNKGEGNFGARFGNNGQRPPRTGQDASGSEQNSPRFGQGNFAKSDGTTRPNFNGGRGGGRNGSFNFFSTILLILQYLLTFGALSIATNWVEKKMKKPTVE